MSKDLGWVRAVHPDDRATMEAAWQQAMVSGVLDVEHRLMSLGHIDEARWFRTFATPLSDNSSGDREWLGVCTDIHETRMLEQQQQLQLDMLQRRVFNVLALTRSVARRTAKASDTVESFALHLDSRLDAIARIQTMLLHDISAGVDLEHLVADGLLAHAAHEGEQVHVAGPPLLLRGKAAELVGLTMHELAMNAVKHGALGTPQGHVSVTWSVEQAGRAATLHFEWLESDVTVPDAPVRHKGFGTELIEQTLQQELDAVAVLSVGPQGVRCTIDLPLTTEFVIPSLRTSRYYSPARSCSLLRHSLFAR